MRLFFILKSNLVTAKAHEAIEKAKLGEHVEISDLEVLREIAATIRYREDGATFYRFDDNGVVSYSPGEIIKSADQNIECRPRFRPTST